MLLEATFSKRVRGLLGRIQPRAKVLSGCLLPVPARRAILEFVIELFFMIYWPAARGQLNPAVSGHS